MAIKLINLGPYALKAALVVLLCFGVLADSVSLLLPFSAELAFAADAERGGSRKKTKKRKRRVKRKKGEKETGQQSSVGRTGHGVAEPAPVLGTEGGFGHKEFDTALGKSGALDAVLILDASRSMQRTDPNRLRDQGAKLFLRFLSEGDRIAVIQFEQDTKVIVPFTPVTTKVLAEIDKAIENIPNEGNFTDLWSPIIAALQLLTEQGRRGTEKSVILLSDGQMDPHPRIGTRDELIARLRENDLPAYNEQEIKLYTLALSEGADRQLLAEMARLTGGLNWYAPNFNAIHKIFSDLFLTLKMPQVVSLEDSGFEIDGTTSEATFYITREDPDQVVTIVDPRGKKFSNLDFPPGVKWHRGDRFDVVTIKRPHPGPWNIKGLDNPEGFATLLTDLKLQIRWPESHLRVGDSMVFMGRLTEGGGPVSTPGIQEVTFFSFKIVDSVTGQLLLQGSMNDKGQDGDMQAGDGIYSDTIKIDEEGEYKALLSVTGPTFTRQQHISFNVSKGSINLVREPANEFTGEPEGLRVIIGKKGTSLKNLKVRLIAQKAGEDEALAIPVDEFKMAEGKYNAPVHLLESGQYKLSARLSGIDAEKKDFDAVSETITYTVKNKKGAETSPKLIEKLIVDESETEDDGEGGGIILSIASLILSCIWAGALGSLVYKKSGRTGGVVVEKREAYSTTTELNERLQVLREKSSKEKRKPNEGEDEIFKVDVSIQVAAPKVVEPTVEQEVSAEPVSEETETLEEPVSEEPAVKEEDVEEAGEEEQQNEEDEELTEEGEEDGEEDEEEKT